jgi:hypothetical protein
LALPTLRNGIPGSGTAGEDAVSYAIGIPYHRRNRTCIINFEVQFPFWSEKRQGGFSGIMEAPGELVHGALYEVTEQELITLDSIRLIYIG